MIWCDCTYFKALRPVIHYFPQMNGIVSWSFFCVEVRKNPCTEILSLENRSSFITYKLYCTIVAEKCYMVDAICCLFTQQVNLW